MSSQKTIFVLGGSGYIGSVLIKLAIESGYKVQALSRSETSDAKLSALGATPIRGDLTTHSVLTEAASKADIVVNLAGNIGNISQEQRFVINNAAIDALAKGLEGTEKVFVTTHGSLIAAADPNGEETDENAPRMKGDFFNLDFEGHALSKAEQGVRVCSIRLAPYVYGRAGSGVKMMMHMFARAGSGFYVAPGSACTSTIHVDDAARLYLLAAEKAKAGDKFNATSETKVTQKQIAEAVGKTMGVEVKEQSHEDTVAKLGPFFATFFSAANRASNAKAKKDLAWDIRAERGILEEIESGSYFEAAQELEKEYQYLIS
ncbi:putative NAD dependent epimerase/dehydratase [Pleomassaria siparia CBS 279.74]|uniref:Putative NAD dependent epimerase/dehydratase n=1 Tax=Pleomassaria siparia CBS 279.74 TaxID=1314801 RepID=A0A6G1KQM7_9PLEO|nr:putative NAD dependent epimerase/dehydratase [Pleomassaria siparia CBS 279.74]